MAEKESNGHVVPYRIAAQTENSTVHKNGNNDESCHAAHVCRQTQSQCTAAKTYGNVFASEDSRVHLGDIHIYNVGASRRDILSLQETASYWQYFDRTTKTLIAVTGSHRAQSPLLPWLIKVTHEQLDIRSDRELESYRFFQIDVLRRWRLHLGFGTTQNVHLHIYRPRIHNVIPDSAPIMLASQNGDLMTVRHLLLNRQASVTDITTGNLSPLFHAIDHGHIHIVRELLREGADPNQAVGENQTSPLQWAVLQRDETMIRLLIEYGASLQHVSRLGRSVLSYLWISEEEVRPSCIALMHLLRTADSAEFRRSHQMLIDIYGFSTINRVACMGIYDELDLLLRDGAETTSVIELDWDAMFNATHQGDLQNVKVLAPYFPGYSQSRDLRGWTLLHVAAERGHLDIVKYLIENGADWRAKSWPSREHIHHSLKGKICTPAQVAAAESVDRELAFLGIVREVLGNSQRAYDEKDDLFDHVDGSAT